MMKSVVQYQPFGFANIDDVQSVPLGTNQLIRINGRKHGGPNGAVLLQKLNDWYIYIPVTLTVTRHLQSLNKKLPRNYSN